MPATRAMRIDEEQGSSLFGCAKQNLHYYPSFRVRSYDTQILLSGNEGLDEHNRTVIVHMIFQ